MSNNQRLQDDVKAFVRKTITSLNIDWSDEDGRIDPICQVLRIITDEFTVEKYDFTLAMDVFVETAPKELSLCLEEILSLAEADADYDAKENVYFAAYYALSLIYKKEDNQEGLLRLTSAKYDIFGNFALHFEVYSRYFKRVDNFKKALSCDKLAINVLGSRGVENVGLLISYASTVCIMLRKREPSLKDNDIALAKQYIDRAIAFNPAYPKYYFLKAQLTFLSAVREGMNTEQLIDARDEATALIDEQADVYLYNIYYNRNRYLEKERAKYEEFKEYMDDVIDRKASPRFPVSLEELERRKKAILEASDQDHCVSASILPPLPDLRRGDKFFFVCYSSKDFKSVYCDLIELYKRKVPFRYDERLTQGLDWKGLIAKGIGSEDCQGVVFYLSKRVMSTESVCEEIKITEEYKKEHFFVNLEGNIPPSKMLSDLLVERHAVDPKNYYISGKNMKIFLNFFDDSEVFTHKFPEKGDSDITHIDTLVNSITNKFSEIIIGD